MTVADARAWAKPHALPSPAATAIPVATGLNLAALVVTAALVPLLPPLGWKVKVTMAAAVLQVGGFYVLARTGRLRRSPVDLPALLFLAAAIAATVFSVDRLVSFFPSPLRGDGLPVFAAYVLAAVGAARLPAGQRRVLLWAILAAGGVIGFTALGQYYGADPLRWAGFDIAPLQVGAPDGTPLFVVEPVDPGMRSIGTLGQSIVLGGLAILLLPVAASFAVQSPRPLAGLLAGVVTVALYAGLVASQTRAAWVAAAASGALVVALLPKSRAAWLRLAVLAGVLAAVTVIMVATNPRAGLAHRATSLAGAAQRQDRSLEQRVYMWDQTLMLIRQRPVLGWGFSTMLGRLPGYGSAEYRRLFGQEAVEVIDNPHNELLSIAFSLGLAGLAAYLWVWTAGVSGAIRGWRQGRMHASNQPGALLAALAAYAIWMQSAWSHIGAANILWVFLGLAAACGTPPAAGHRHHPQSDPVPTA